MENTIWQQFAQKNNLSPRQLQQFQDYYRLLIEANELFNITAITDLESVIAYHFQDSITLKDSLDLTKIGSLCDIGSGGGFPGIPLKIIYPHIDVTLLEVSQKKGVFLRQVIEKLELLNIDVCDLDWRNFLRQADGEIELFCARASLHPDELLRVFSGSSPYQNSNLVYWASQDWQPTKKESPLLRSTHRYAVGDRQRKYCIFSKAR